MSQITGASDTPDPRTRCQNLLGVLDAVHPFMIWRNRRLIAERSGWPAGTLEDCEQLEDLYPGWSVSWSQGITWGGPDYERAAGFYAWRTGCDPGRLVFPGGGRPPRYQRREEVYAADAATLKQLLRGRPLPRRWP